MPFTTSRTTSCLKYNQENDACLPCTDPFERKKCSNLYIRYKQATTAQEQLDARLQFYDEGCVSKECYNMGHCTRLKSLNQQDPRVKAFCDQAAQNQFFPQDLATLDAMTTEELARLLSQLNAAPPAFRQNVLAVLTGRINRLQSENGDLYFTLNDVQNEIEQYGRKYEEFTSLVDTLRAQLEETEPLVEQYRAQLDASLQKRAELEQQSAEQCAQLDTLGHLADRVHAFSTFDIDPDVEEENATLEDDISELVLEDEKEEPVPSSTQLPLGRTEDQILAAAVRKQRLRKRKYISTPTPVSPELQRLLETEIPHVRVPGKTVVEPRYTITMNESDGDKVCKMLLLVLKNWFQSPITQAVMILSAQTDDPELWLMFPTLARLVNDLLREPIIPFADEVEDRSYLMRLFFYFGVEPKMVYSQNAEQMIQSSTDKERTLFSENMHIVETYCELFCYASIDFDAIRSLATSRGVVLYSQAPFMTTLLQLFNGLVYRQEAQVIGDYLFKECMRIFHTRNGMLLVFPGSPLIQLTQKFFPHAVETLYAHILTSIDDRFAPLTSSADILQLIERLSPSAPPLVLDSVFVAVVRKFVPQLALSVLDLLGV